MNKNLYFCYSAKLKEWLDDSFLDPINEGTSTSGKHYWAYQPSHSLNYELMNYSSSNEKIFGKVNKP